MCLTSSNHRPNFLLKTFHFLLFFQNSQDARQTGNTPKHLNAREIKTIKYNQDARQTGNTPKHLNVREIKTIKSNLFYLYL